MPPLPRLGLGAILADDRAAQVVGAFAGEHRNKAGDVLAARAEDA